MRQRLNSEFSHGSYTSGLANCFVILRRATNWARRKTTAAFNEMFPDGSGRFLVRSGLSQRQYLHSGSAYLPTWASILRSQMSLRVQIVVCTNEVTAANPAIIQQNCGSGRDEACAAIVAPHAYIPSVMHVFVGLIDGRAYHMARIWRESREETSRLEQVADRG